MVRERAVITFEWPTSGPVGQVHLRSRLDRPATVQDIRARSHLPAPEVTGTDSASESGAHLPHPGMAEGPLTSVSDGQAF